MNESSAPRHQAAIGDRLRSLLAAEAPGWLETRRWFADKGRAIAAVDIDDLLIEPVGADTLALVVARVRFASGDEARYFLPLAITAAPDDAGIIASVPMPSISAAVVDATETPWFGPWLLRAIAGAGTAPARWRFRAGPGADGLLEAAGRFPGTLMRAEQSNSSLRFDNELIVKLFRRLQPGPNPDEEVLRALAARSFPRVPPYAGGASWHAGDGAEHPIVLAQGFVPNLGDGWSWMLGRLAALAGQQETEPGGGLEPERLLGQRTAELHLALSRVPDADFVPQPASAAMIEEDIRRTREAVAAIVALLLERREALPETVRSRLPEVSAGLRALSERAEGYRREAGLARIRVHGDYHLGQTLRTRDDDWMMIDFEGEPARPVAERRQRTSPLKDVAGMLRSFAYARGAAERVLAPAASSIAEDRLARWERQARSGFLAGYRATIAARAPAASPPLVPDDEAAFAAALAAWELDKALYEIAYEARNRPDWLALPLRALLPDLLDQSPGATGAAPA